MMDLNKASKCEGLDEESWKRNRLGRAAKLIFLPDSTVWKRQQRGRCPTSIQPGQAGGSSDWNQRIQGQ